MPESSLEWSVSLTIVRSPPEHDIEIAINTQGISSNPAAAGMSVHAHTYTHSRHTHTYTHSRHTHTHTHTVDTHTHTHTVDTHTHTHTIDTHTHTHTVDTHTHTVEPSIRFGETGKVSKCPIICPVDCYFSS